MPSYLGVDWAGGCWLVVKTGDETLVTTEPSIFNVWHEHGKAADVQSILVDIPIGLPESGTRACDEKASEMLADRGSTIFSIPCREVVEADEYEDARKTNDGSLGSQSWWLFPRIKEVDVFLQEHDEAIDKVYESHPEVCFTTLADESPTSKSTKDGREERLEILSKDQELYDEVEEIVRDREQGAEWHDRISKGRVDDVIDAAVLALTAKELKLSSRSVTDEYPAFSEKAEQGEDEILGISPEIVCSEPHET